MKAKDNDDATPLHWAASQDHADVARVLIEAGADMEGRTMTTQPRFIGRRVIKP